MEANKAISRFDKCVEFILQREGGLVNHKYDRGGKTKYGISKNAFPHLDIENLTIDEAKEIYRKEYWDECNCGLLPEGLDVVVFDTAVNSGVGRAKSFLTKTQNVEQYLNLRLNYYYQIVKNNPTQSVFLQGWKNRLNHLRGFINENNS